MKLYKVNNIFYSLQGEGRNTGRAAVFIRFAGCNLQCPFCDTEFNSYTEMTAEEIIAKTSSLFTLRSALPLCYAKNSSLLTLNSSLLTLIVLTGGEPTLQVDESFIDLLHNNGYEVAMESNGILPAPNNLDWLTVSPKNWWKTEGAWQKENIGARQPDELKIVFDEDTPTRLSTFHLPPSTIHHPPSSLHLPPSTPLLYLQPCDTGNPERNAHITTLCVDYIQHHPQWRLSLQTHKLIGIE